MSSHTCGFLLCLLNEIQLGCACFLDLSNCRSALLIDITNQRSHLLLWRSSQLRYRSPNLPYLTQTILHWLERCPMKLPSTSYPLIHFSGSEENLA